MLEKPKRAKQLNNQDRQLPATIQELINRYDLENKDIYKFLDYLVDSINNKTSTGEGSVAGDTLPIGAVVDYDGKTVPSNWEEVEDTETVLYENESGTSGISTKTISIENLSNYSSLEIEGFLNHAENIIYFRQTVPCIVGGKVHLWQPSYNGTTYTYVSSETLIINEDSISRGTQWLLKICNGDSAREEAYEMYITKITGYKEV